MLIGFPTTKQNLYKPPTISSIIRSRLMRKSCLPNIWRIILRIKVFLSLKVLPGSILPLLQNGETESPLSVFSQNMTRLQESDMPAGTICWERPYAELHVH